MVREAGVDDALALAVSLNEWMLTRFREDLDNVTREEAEWRPLSQANRIGLILRYLRIRAEWHPENPTYAAPVYAPHAGEGDNT